MDSANNPKILVIVPAFNEEGNLPRILKDLLLEFDPESILVVNDGSCDSTGKIARKFSVNILDLPYNLGIGGAVQSGYIYAKKYDYDIAVQVDADGQHDPAYIRDIINPIVEGKADFVVGSRFLGLDKKGDRSTLCRRIGIAYFALLLSFITGRRITDPTSGFRAAGRKAILALAKRYPVDYPEVESLLYLARCGLGIVEVPVSMRKRFEGRSSISTLSSIFYILKVSIGIGLLLLERNQNI